MMDYDEMMAFKDREEGGDGVRPLVFTGGDLTDMHEEDLEVARMAMEQDMMDRQICPCCGHSIEREEA